MPLVCTLSLKFFLLNLILGKGGKFCVGLDINIFETVHKTGNCLVDLIYKAEVAQIRNSGPGDDELFSLAWQVIFQFCRMYQLIFWLTQSKVLHLNHYGALKFEIITFKVHKGTSFFYPSFSFYYSYSLTTVFTRCFLTLLPSCLQMARSLWLLP